MEGKKARRVGSRMTDCHVNSLDAGVLGGVD